MAKKVPPIPEGYHAVTAGLCPRDAAKAIEFYKKAFGAQEIMRMPGPDGKIMHAEIKIGDSFVFVNDEFPDMPGSPRSPDALKGTTGGFYLYVNDADAVFAQAVKAGAKPTMPMTDMFWGDRMGQVKDPFGYLWNLATHKEDPTREQMIERQKEFFAAVKK